jgi:hypothetical protein
MNGYLFIHRIRGPVMIVVFGITALLNQWGILSYGESWPLYLIVLGILQLAERAAWSQMQAPQPYAGTYPPPQPGMGPNQWPNPTAGAAPSSAALAITPVFPPDEERK